MKHAFLAEATSSNDKGKSTYKKKYKCPYCDLRFERAKLHIHIQDKHEDEIPEGYTALRVAFNTINNKTEGHCIICKDVTDWNEDKGRYNRLCNKPECKEKYKQMCAERNRKIYGTDRLQNDPRYKEEVERKALAGRKTAGKYKFADGGEVQYMGSYERKLLEFMDKVMHCLSEDILAPGPAIEYEFQGGKHIYLPDFYYIPYNLLIEIKDGGSNPNGHPKRTGEDEERMLAKEEAVVKGKEFNYVRVVDNDFGQLLSIMANIKYHLMYHQYYYGDPIIMINESYVFNEKDIYYNKDKFDSGEINLCFITGHSGSGKSTMAAKMKEKNKVEHYSLDDIFCIKDHFTLEELREGYGDLIYSYFAGPGKKFYVGVIDVKNTPESEYEDKLCPDFVHYAMKYAKSHKDRKFSVEGVWLFAKSGEPPRKYWFEPSEFKDYAFYIKGTSMLISKIRGSKRDSKDAETKLGRVKSFVKGAFFRNWKFFINDEKDINRFRDYFKNLMKQDKVNEDMSGTIAAALPLTPAPMPYESDKTNYYLVQNTKDGIPSYNITKDPEQYSMLSVDPEDKKFYKVFKSDKGKFDKEYVTFKIKDKQSAKQLYDELSLIASSNNQRIMESNCKSNYIYWRLTNGCEISDPKQLFYDNRFELVKSPEEKLNDLCESVYKYLKAKPIDMLEEQINQLSQNWKRDDEQMALFDENYIIESNARNMILNEELAITISDNEKLFPVYVVCVGGTTWVANKIKQVTKSTYSHAAISLEPDMDKLYAFNGAHRNQAGNKGFRFESFKEYLKDYNTDNFPICINVFFAKENLYKNLKSRLDYYVNKQAETKYDYINLFRILFHKSIEINNDLKFVCSEFVASVMDYLGINITNGKKVSLTTPDDLAKSYLMNDKVYNVYASDYKNFSPATLKDSTLRIKEYAKSIIEATLLEDGQVDNLRVDWSLKMDKARNAEADGLIIMVDIDSGKYISDYTEDNIIKFKEKWNRFNSLPSDKRVLSNQTASDIFGIDNEVLYSRILNAYLTKFNSGDPTENGYLGPSTLDNIISSNTNSNNSTSSIQAVPQISRENAQLLSLLSIKLDNTSNEEKRLKIKTEMSNLGWNPEVPYSKESENIKRIIESNSDKTLIELAAMLMN